MNAAPVFFGGVWHDFSLSSLSGLCPRVRLREAVFHGVITTVNGPAKAALSACGPFLASVAGTVILLITAFTPLMLVASVVPSAFSAMSLAFPLNVTTPEAVSVLE
jgi:hypothetical protein